MQNHSKIPFSIRLATVSDVMFRLVLVIVFTQIGKFFMRISKFFVYFAARKAGITHRENIAEIEMIWKRMNEGM